MDTEHNIPGRLAFGGTEEAMPGPWEGSKCCPLHFDAQDHVVSWTTASHPLPTSPLLADPLLLPT